MSIAAAILLQTALVGQKPVDLSPKIVSASIFKNGYVVITREMDLPSVGEFTLAKLPGAAMGTLWFKTSEGTLLESVTSADVDSEFTRTFGSLEEILANNIGKTLQVTYRLDKDPLQYEGVLKANVGEVAILETATGTISLKEASIFSINAPGKDLVYQAKGNNKRRVLKVKSSGKPGKLYMMSLEKGISWAPAYAVDVTNKKELKLTAKATLLNDLEAMKDVETRLITGFPNIPYAAYLDPLLTGRAGAVLEQMPGGFGGGGGLGGPGGGAARGAMLNQAPAPIMADFDASMAGVTGPGGEQREDLFFYKMPAVTLGTSERAYRVMFSMTSPYRDLYTWDIADTMGGGIEYRPIPEGPQEVWHALKFKNNSGQPLTTSVATTFDTGEIIGQDMLGYVPNGGEAELRINKALDIRAEGTENEVSRERGAVKNRDGNPIYDLVVIEGQLQVTNLKGNTVQMRIKRDLTGEVTDNKDQAVVVKTASGLTQMNPSSRLTWNKDLKSGERMTLAYRYKLYVRTSL